MRRARRARSGEPLPRTRRQRTWKRSTGELTAGKRRGPTVIRLYDQHNRGRLVQPHDDNGALSKDPRQTQRRSRIAEQQKMRLVPAAPGSGGSRHCVSSRGATQTALHAPVPAWRHAARERIVRRDERRGPAAASAQQPIEASRPPARSHHHAVHCIAGHAVGSEQCRRRPVRSAHARRTRRRDEHAPT